MGFLSNKQVDLNNEYAMMESKMIATPKALMKGLGVRDMDLKVNRDLTLTQMQQSFEKLRKQKHYNLMLLRDFVASDQKNFFATGDVNLEIRNLFKDVDITDSIVISRRIKEVKEYTPAQYSDHVLWNYFNDLSRIHRHAFCVSGSLDQIDSLILLNLKKGGKNGAILQDGSCFFPVKLYEEFFSKISNGNNVVVI